MHLRLVLLASFLLCSCSKTETSGQTWTLQTGVSVLEAKICDATSVKDGLSVSKQSAQYVVELSDTFSCGVNLHSPWLTVVKSHKATLVLGAASGGSACECRGKVRIHIANRLEPGDTLYVLNENEVVGHVVLP